MPTKSKESTLAAKSSESETESDYSSESESYLSGTPSSAGSEEVEVEPFKVDVLLVTGGLMGGKVKFSINSSQRSKTGLTGGDQGDHSISYVTILQAILSSTEEQTIVSAIKQVKFFGEGILEGGYLTSFRDIEYPIVYETEDRREAREVLSKSDSFKDKKDAVDSMNKSMKRGKTLDLVEHLVKLSNSILTSVQKQSLTTFYSRGRIKPPAGDEKHSARALVMLDKLCALCEMDGEEFDKNLESFKHSLKSLSGSETEDEHVIRYGLAAWFREGKKGNDVSKEANKKVDGVLAVLEKKDADKKECLKKLRNDLLGNKDELARHMGVVIDYERVLEFNLTDHAKLNVAFLLTGAEEKKVKEGSDKKGIIRDKAGKFFDLAVHNINFSEKKILLKGSEVDVEVITISRADAKDLAKILDKFNKVIYSAFPNIRKNLIDNSTFNTQYDNFLQKEILDKGWKDLEITDEDTGAKTNLDLKILKTLIASSKPKAVSTEEKKGACMFM